VRESFTSLDVDFSYLLELLLSNLLEITSTIIFFYLNPALLYHANLKYNNEYSVL